MRERSRSARKYARGGGIFDKFLKFTKLDTKLLEHNFSVLPKIDECQVDLANSWRCLAPAVVKHPLSSACTPNIEELEHVEDEPAAQYAGPTMRARERRGERWEHQRWAPRFQVIKKCYNSQTKKPN
jgi:hypothetical protein